MDRIILSGVQVYAYGGVTEEERLIGQRYEFDIALGLDLRAAGRSDSIEDTVSYAEVHSAAMEAMRGQPFALIEHAAQRVADRVLDRFPCDEVTVSLRKLMPPIDGVVAAAGVEIRRNRREQGSD